MPQPNIEEITRLLADTQIGMREILVALVANDATPHVLSCVIGAMHNLNEALIDYKFAAMPGFDRPKTSWVDPVLAEKFDSIDQAISRIEQRLPQSE